MLPPGPVEGLWGPDSSLGPFHTQEAWELHGPSEASASVPPWLCSSAAILGRREQSFNEHLLCVTPHLTVPTVAQ